MKLKDAEFYSTVILFFHRKVDAHPTIQFKEII